jgi:hypothetical protein
LNGNTIQPRGGTALTIGLAQEFRKPYAAGPRESDNPGIYDLTVRFLKNLLIKNKPPGQSKGCGGSKKTGIGGYQ